jgi:putative redox protein
VADQLEVCATWLGGYRLRVNARGHELAVDEPRSDGGGDGGMMPTELFCASLASCFGMALAFAAAKRGRELPGLRVAVRAERAGRELRYDRLRIEAQARVPDEELAGLMEPARRLCWVSNMLTQGVELSYHSTSVDGYTQK